MKNKFSKSLAILIVIGIVSSSLAIMPVFAANITTYATCMVIPNPLGAGETGMIIGMISPANVYTNVWFTITDPTPSTSTISGLSTDASGMVSTSFTPTIVGTYTITFNFGGETIGADYYLPSSASTDTAGGSFSVIVTPTSHTMDQGNTQDFTATVSGGTAPYHYEVYYDGILQFSFDTMSSSPFTYPYTATSLGPHNTQVSVSDATASVAWSNLVPITVVAPPVITIAPSGGLAMDLGQSQVLTSSVSDGIGPFSYQWYLDGSPVSGATSDTWTYMASTLYDHSVLCMVTDADSGFDQSNTVTVYVSPALAPVTITPAGPVTMDAGQVETFTANAAGGSLPFLIVTWYINGNPVAAGPSSTYQYTGVSPGTPQTLSVEVTDSAYSPVTVTSTNTVSITVNPAPGVTIDPPGVVMEVGQSQVLTSSVSDGTAPFIYQWYLDGSPVSGATSDTWTYSPSSDGTYSVYLGVTDSVGGVATSNTVDVTVYEAVGVTIDPPGVVYMEVGQSHLFTATVLGGTAPFSYQWYLDGSPVSGATSDTLTYSPSSPGLYSVYVTVQDGLSQSSSSNTITVDVSSGLTVTIDPSGTVTTDVGIPVEFTSAISGGVPDYSYEWLLGASVVADTPTWTYTPSAQGSYTVQLRVTDGYDYTAYCDVSAVVTVNALPSPSIQPPSVRSMDVGQSTLFECGISGGTGSFLISWYFDGSPVGTGYSWMYVPSSGEEGYHDVEVDVVDAVGGTGYDAGAVTVYPELSVSVSPSSVTMFPDHSLQEFTASISGGAGSFSYQWYLDGGVVSGATSDTYIYSPILADLGSHTVYVVVTDAVSASATSNFASVDVIEPASITVTSNFDGSLGDPPASDWSYLITYPDASVDDFTLAAGGGGSTSYTYLMPGTYTIAQTTKWRYGVESTTVNGGVFPATIEDNRTSLTMTLLPGDDMSVVFNNEYIPDVTFAKPVPPVEDSSPLDYGLPSLCAVPVQSTWDPHIDADDSIDLVMGKPMKIMVSLADLITDSTVDPNAVVLVSLVSLDGFFSTPLADEERIVSEINPDECVIIFDAETPSTAAEYTITCTITVNGNMYHTEDTPVSVKETSPLSLYYIPLKAGYEVDGTPMEDYGTLDSNAFNAMVGESSEFVEAVYPVPTVAVKTPLDDASMALDEASVEGNPTEPNWYGMYKDCLKAAGLAKQQFPQTSNVIGVGVAPFTGKRDNYFFYHGAVSGGKHAVGVSFGPSTKGVVALEGYYTAVAHEIGHTFDLYYGEPEQYELFNPGKPANGFNVTGLEWRSSYDFMGLAPLQSTTTVWVTADFTFQNIFSSLKSANDPEIIFVSGIITEDENGEYLEMPLDWFSMPYGTPDTIPEGQYALRFNLADGTTVETSFEASTTMHICPGIEAGEDIQEDYPGLGEIPLDFAGFAFATTYPEDTISIDVLDTNNTEDPVIETIYPDEVVPSMSGYFGGFQEPINSDGSSVFKLKSTVPLKFQLQEADGAYITDAVVTLDYIKISNGVVGTQAEATTNVQATTGNLFRYDSSNNQYVYNWKTKGLTPGTYRLIATFEDGNSETVQISLR